MSPRPLSIIYQDDSLLVIDKPAGLVVDKSNTQQTDTLEDILSAEYGIEIERSGIVHRLDKDTSGVLVVAKTEAALANLQAQFKERQTKKEYLTLVHGKLEISGKVEGNIGRSPKNPEKFAVLTNGGKEAVTEYEPVEKLQLDENKLSEIFPDFNKIQMRKLHQMNYGQFTYIKCHPLTGRTHQIRVHLRYIGHAVVGDSKYAGRKVARLDQRFCPRQFLHAARLELIHPVTQEKMEFVSPLPPDLAKALSYLKNE
ncbi:MAG: RluA family pseudouridine synthase [Candidatus Daviesbacteria bacterium]|nr:RluA family pseudouridine synthase [Candidatus Daviesbacteria bacterium]